MPRETLLHAYHSVRSRQGASNVCKPVLTRCGQHFSCICCILLCPPFCAGAPQSDSDCSDEEWAKQAVVDIALGVDLDPSLLVLISCEDFRDSTSSTTSSNAAVQHRQLLQVRSCSNPAFGLKIGVNLAPSFSTAAYRYVSGWDVPGHCCIAPGPVLDSHTRLQPLDFFPAMPGCHSSAVRSHTKTCTHTQACTHTYMLTHARKHTLIQTLCRALMS